MKSTADAELLANAVASATTSLEAGPHGLMRRQYSCRLVTPMFGGGIYAGEVDQDMPIRASAIRGQLRFWWRLLNRRDANGHERPAQELFKLERQIWGGLGDADSLAKSRVSVQVACRPAQRTEKVGESKPNHKGRLAFHYARRFQDGLDYALFPLAPNAGKSEIGSVLTEGYGFDLCISSTSAVSPLTDDEWAAIDEATRWWASFGGVGARTRRGLGAIEVKRATGALMPPPTVEDCEQVGARLLVRNESSESAVAAWKFAVSRLREFRQGAGVGRNPPAKSKGPKSPPGRTRWPEADAIRQITRRHAPEHKPEHAAGIAFPRAAFGLPIITQFKDQKNGDPPNSELLPLVRSGRTKGVAKRMASPIILRPIQIKKQWHAAVLRLPLEHMTGMGLVLTFDKQEQRFGPDEWWNPALQEQVAPMKGRGSNSLDAFLSYFMQGSDATQALERPAAVSGPTTYRRPNVERISDNAILIDTADGKKTLIRDEANKLINSLSDYAQKRLNAGKKFNRLDITLDGDRLIKLTEYKE